MQLSQAIQIISEEAVQHVNECINSDYYINTIYGGETLQDRYKEDRITCPSQATQTLTVAIQGIINAGIRKSLKKHGFGRSEEVAGYDYVILDEELEFKLCGSTKKSQFATGGRSAALYGRKVPLNWIIKYEFANNHINKIAVAIVDLSKCNRTDWKAATDNTGFSSLTIHKDDISAISTTRYGIIKPATKLAQLIPTEVKFNSLF